ncbi:hypothetical protein SEA_VIEENROSE_53 [Streptomyces phage VieEnRose]|nr:hypothetical protein SEA_VIEENROSE_53 [Streptomyces phage VieEnRose]
MSPKMEWLKVRWTDASGRSRESVCYYDRPSGLDRVAEMLLDDIDAELVEVPPPFPTRGARP